MQLLEFEVGSTRSKSVGNSFWYCFKTDNAEFQSFEMGLHYGCSVKPEKIAILMTPLRKITSKFAG
jgi:hypothetical protein